MSQKRPFSASAYVRKGDDQDFENQIVKAQHEYRDARPNRSGEPQKLRVLSVDAGSVAERIGLKPGDEIHELNGKPLLDVIDFQFQAGSIGRRSSIRTQDRKITFVRREWESFGLEFEPIEPMTCAPNAFATGEGVIRLEPGESVALAWGLRQITQDG